MPQYFKLEVTDKAGKKAVHTVAIGGTMQKKDAAWVEKRYKDFNVYPGHQSLKAIDIGTTDTPMEDILKTGPEIKAADIANATPEVKV